MPRLTESKGMSVPVFVRIPQEREQRLFVWCCICLRVFREKQNIWQKSGISFVPNYLGAFFYAIVPDVWSGKVQPILREAGCLFCRTFWNENGSDGCVQPTETWKN